MVGVDSCWGVMDDKYFDLDPLEGLDLSHDFVVVAIHPTCVENNRNCVRDTLFICGRDVGTQNRQKRREKSQ